MDNITKLRDIMKYSLRNILLSYTGKDQAINLFIKLLTKHPPHAFASVDARIQYRQALINAETSLKGKESLTSMLAELTSSLSFNLAAEGMVDVFENAVIEAVKTDAVEKHDTNAKIAQLNIISNSKTKEIENALDRDRLVDEKWVMTVIAYSQILNEPIFLTDFNELLPKS